MQKIIKVPSKSKTGEKMQEANPDETEEKKTAHLFLSTLQELTGFSRNVLAKPEEDVWNEL